MIASMRQFKEGKLFSRDFCHCGPPGKKLGVSAEPSLAGFPKMEHYAKTEAGAKVIW